MFPLRPANFSLAPEPTAGQVAAAAQPAPAPVQAQAPEQAPVQAPQKGGYGSAATYVESVAGGLNTQYGNTFNQAGAYGKFEGNLLPVDGGKNLMNMSGVPTPQQLAMAQSGGRRRKGGFLGPVLNQAAVPLALLAMQQTYRRKSRRGSRRSRTARRSRKSRR